MTYDRTDWHSGGDYPDDLPPENGGTHIGIYLAWAILHGLESPLHQTNSAAAIEALRSRKITGRHFLENECDGKFTENDLSPEGNTFTKHYYESNSYLNDYDTEMKSGLPSLYHVTDSWENYDRMSIIIDRRFSRKKWWEFWKK